MPTLASATEAEVLTVLVDAVDLVDLAGEVTAGLTLGLTPWAAGTEAASASSARRGMDACLGSGAQEWFSRH